MNFLILITLVGLATATNYGFENYKLIRAYPVTPNQIEFLRSFLNINDIDIWSSSDSEIDFVLSPNDYELYKHEFYKNQVNFKVIQNDLQRIIDDQLSSKREPIEKDNIVGTYAKYSEIMNFMDNLEKRNHKLVKSYNIGTTYEKRKLRVIRIKNRKARKLKKIWIDCGIHAREWVAISTCVYIIDRLVKDYNQNDFLTKKLFDRYEFHILPMVNPDGYVYSHTKNNRLWRKNRKPVNGTCIGTEINRNFDFQWMVSGFDINPCSDSYAGKKPASEIETQAIQKTILKSKSKWAAFITLHSYGGYWMPPWAYTSVLPDDYEMLKRVSEKAVEKIKEVDNSNFKVGTPALTIGYNCSGVSYDWAKAKAGIKHSYALELRPVKGTPDHDYGFLLPENRSILAGKETYAGLFEFFQLI